jgi:hypothetical protein
MGSDKVFIVGSRVFIYIMKSKGPKIDPWGTPYFTVPHFGENFSNDFVYVSLFSTCQIGSEPVSYCFLNAHNNVTSLSKFHDLHSQKLLLNHRIFPQHAFFWLMGLSILFVSLKEASSVDFPCLKPNSYGTNKLLICI